jgi:2-polyprenyl-3-methyl-5-hydroxy-6-metoxy-1,4-benzoquinol methylase
VSGPPDDGLRRELDRVARGHHQDRGFTPRLIACRARQLRDLLSPGRVLDLGCADGLLTARLAEHHRVVVGVDASPVRLERAAAACAALPEGRLELRRALFESFEPEAGERFDAVVLSCILEHLPHPEELLRRAAGWLAPGGRVVAIVPNAGSIHRRTGVLMGLLPDLESLGDADEALDHHRVYTLDRLRHTFEAAGLTVTGSGGYLLKPLPNDRMAEMPAQLVDAWEELGRQFPELAAEIWTAGAP